MTHHRRRAFAPFLCIATLLWAWCIVPQAGATDHENDWLHHVEATLNRAAVQSTAWHANQTRIQRTVHDISVILESAWKAARRADPTEAAYQTKQALSLLERSVSRGYFRQQDLAPVYRLIERYLPQPSA